MFEIFVFFFSLSPLVCNIPRLGKYIYTCLCPCIIYIYIYIIVLDNALCNVIIYVYFMCTKGYREGVSVLRPWAMSHKWIPLPTTNLAHWQETGREGGREGRGVREENDLDNGVWDLCPAIYWILKEHFSGSLCTQREKKKNRKVELKIFWVPFYFAKGQKMKRDRERERER